MALAHALQSFQVVGLALLVIMVPFAILVSGSLDSRLFEKMC